MTTDHCVRPPSVRPASVADTTPGVPTMARCNSVGAPGAADHARGSVSPPGKWAATVSYPETDSALTRNCSVCDSPVGCRACRSPGPPATGSTRWRPDRAPRHGGGDPVPRAGRHGVRITGGLRDERPEQPHAAQRQQRRQHQQREQRCHNQTRRRLHAQAAGARRRREQQRQQGQHHGGVAGDDRRPGPGGARAGALAPTPRPVVDRRSSIGANSSR